MPITHQKFVVILEATAKSFLISLLLVEPLKDERLKEEKKNSGEDFRRSCFLVV